MLQSFRLIIISCFMRKRIHELFFISNPQLQFFLSDSDILHFGSEICYGTHDKVLTFY